MGGEVLIKGRGTDWYDRLKYFCIKTEDTMNHATFGQSMLLTEKIH